jgi:hypothetical protein
MITYLRHLRTSAHDRRVERRFQRSWDRAVAHAGSDSHLEEINAIFASSVR